MTKYMYIYFFFYVLKISGSSNWLVDPVFNPNQCSSYFEERRCNVKQHLNSKCDRTNTYQCNVCLKSFSHKGSLKRHLVTVVHNL